MPEQLLLLIRPSDKAILKEGQVLLRAFPSTEKLKEWVLRNGIIENSSFAEVTVGKKFVIKSQLEEIK